MVELPVHHVTILSPERPGFSTAPRTVDGAYAQNGQTVDGPAGRYGAAPGSGGQLGGRVESGQGRTISVDGVAVPGPDDGVELQRRQEPFRPAKLKFLTSPRGGYPEEAHRLRQQGEVLLRIAVSAEGSVESVALERSSGYPMLDESALAAAQRWSFEPARTRKGPVASVLLWHRHFNLDD